MFEKRVVVGKQYCVFAPGPVTITASMNNTEVKLVNATSVGKYFFIAPTTKIHSSIDTKCIFEPDNSLTYNIGNNPSWLYSLKAALQILLGETAVIINLAENKLIVHTDRADDTQAEAVDTLLARTLPQNIEVVQYNHNMEISWRDINKYAECVTIADIAAVDINYQNDLTSDGEWVYPVPVLTNISGKMPAEESISSFC